MSGESSSRKRRSFSLPHVYTIVFLLMVVFAVLTWIVPSGSYERKTIQTAAGEKEVAVAGTYKPQDKVYTDSETGEKVDLRCSVMQLLEAPTQGIQAAADVVAFVLLIGGSFAIITKTNAINAGLSHVIGKFKDLPFYAIFIPIMMALGYDSMTAFLICFMGPNIGYIASTVNPFNVLIAQGIVGIEGNPQLWLRAIVWVVFTVLAIVWVMRYARKVKRDPQSSITYKDDIQKRVEFSVQDDAIEQPFSGRQKGVLVVFAVCMGIIIWGLVTQHWYMDEISAVFFGMGVLSGIVAGMSEREIAEEFVHGIADFAYAAIIIGLARSILVIAENGMIIDTILNAMATALAGVPAPVYTTLLYVVLGLLSLLVPSSFGLAALTMPILGPLTQLMGVNPEAAVTALCLANQTINSISPTAGMTVAGLSVSKISFGQWWKTCWKFILLIAVLGVVVTAISGLLPA